MDFESPWSMRALSLPCAHGAWRTRTAREKKPTAASAQRAREHTPRWQPALPDRSPARAGGALQRGSMAPDWLVGILGFSSSAQPAQPFLSTGRALRADACRAAASRRGALRFLLRATRVGGSWLGRRGSDPGKGRCQSRSQKSFGPSRSCKLRRWRE